ncbi:MAG: helix-turn-helix domain-containing protein [Magnetococcales bacterium]|nr:helix-turn-helix domain-containing protein [Magnetococcales bacterium]
MDVSAPTNEGVRHPAQQVVPPIWSALRQPDAARFIGLSESTLEKMRCRGDGPLFSKLGRTVVYDRANLVAWMEARKVKSTSEADARRAEGWR